jgi:hypothetical protein
MYSTCIFCNKPLGRNEALEAFPVGNRLAFDSVRGRLWVVCRACERWNLSPLDERWEAVEQAERAYRDTRRRVATENVGLARLRDGTTLVRIGEPLRPEFAAWRYGDQFGRRRNRALLIAGGGVTALAGVIVGGAVAGVGIGGFVGGAYQVGRAIVHGSPETVVAKIRTEQYGLVHVRRRHLAESSIGRAGDGTLALDLRFKNGSGRFTGREAERIAAIVVPKVNRFGGTRAEVATAVDAIEDVGSSERFLDQLAAVSHVYTRVRTQSRMTRWFRDGQQFTKWGLFGLPQAQRLALEMALHEEAERRAMAGELEELERAWREAEEVAAISDNLLVPESVDEQYRRLREKG